MSCYTRHLGDLLPANPSWDDRRALDARIRADLGMAEADCPEVWAAFKAASGHGRRPGVDGAARDLGFGREGGE